MRHRRSIARGMVCVTVLLTAGTAACGDDEDSLTEEEFVDQANEICDEGSERTDKIFEDLSADSSDDEIEDAIQELADDIEGQIDEIRDLSEPDDISDDVNAALDQAEEDLETMRDQGVDLLEAEEDPFAETNELLSSVGLTSCSEG